MMAAANEFSRGRLPQRLRLEVAVPQRLTTTSVDQTCQMVSSRLRYLLGLEYQRRSAVRLQARLDATAARKAARLEAAARRAVEEEAADQAAKTARRRVS
jgi:biopolymer transport protein ExbB/TolQ